MGTEVAPERGVPVKKVRCVEDCFSFITLNKVYEVIEDGPGGYYIEDDDGDGIWFRKSIFEVIDEEEVTAKDTQIGGNHYSRLAIQPYEYITANGIGMIEGNVIKYVTRWRDKGGVEDLKKAVHSLQWLIEYVEKA